MKKEIKKVFGHNYYLLGKRKEDGQKVWLEEGHFDCGWYYGLGYVEIFNKNYTDIEEHTHFDCLFLTNKIYDSFVDYFQETTLNDKEIWKLLENMKALYTIRDYSDLLHLGGAHITQNDNKEIIKNDAEYKRINDVVIPTLLNEVYKIVGGAENE